MVRPKRAYRVRSETEYTVYAQLAEGQRAADSVSFSGTIEAQDSPTSDHAPRHALGRRDLPDLRDRGSLRRH